MHILLSEDEQGALASCSLEAFRLYVLGLRPVVDIRTGLVGRGFPVSRAQLAINIQFAPPRGSQRAPWKPSLKQLDALVDELTREGLAKRVSTVHEVKKMVLKLPMVLLRPQEERDMSGNNERDMNGTPETQPPQGFCGGATFDEQDATAMNEADISVFRGNDVSCRAVASAASPSATDDLPPFVDGLELSATTGAEAFKRALGSDYAVDAATLGAVSRVAEVARKRPLGAFELGQAVKLARAKGRHVAAYASSIIESGSLSVAASPSPRRGEPSAGGDAVSRRLRRRGAGA